MRPNLDVRGQRLVFGVGARFDDRKSSPLLPFSKEGAAFGFTLIEVLVALAILAIALAAAARAANVATDSAQERSEEHTSELQSQ